MSRVSWCMSMTWPKLRTIDIVAYLLFAGVALRGLRDHSDSPLQWGVAALLLVFLLLRLSEAWVRRRLAWYAHVYFALQTGLVIALSLLPPHVDYFVILCVPLSVDAMSWFTQRTAYAWIGVFILAMAGVLIVTFGLDYTLPFILMYAAVFLFFASYTAITRRAEEARAQSQALLTQLQAAHRDLQDYAAQVEALTAAEERNRLARELHDSVTQTIFSLTLTAQAARMLLDQDVVRAAAQLDRVQELARDALTEMRSLIQQLRPKTVAELGLVPALHRHIAERHKRDGLNVMLGVDAETRLPIDVEEALFRVVQEALNNVVKHAGTDQAEVSLRFEGKTVSVTVADHGVGFDPMGIRSEISHLGLTGMHERVKALGGRLDITSQPGAGTCIQVEVPIVEKEQVAG
jgi:signal transduction histidine kinase